MKSIGSLYVDTIKLKHPIKPMFEWGWTQETTSPYRKSKTCLVIWVPFIPRALVIGAWGEPQNETAVFEAINMREISKFGNLPVGTMSKNVSDWYGSEDVND
ncbi:hypothetical protein UFOVP115_122 [uncultured Caudovirales phage]|uniref:Uncharacterized protein n=1 Tax=uncultured Caudovirales phage TaxID=2100421 RepID=A0A6J5L5Z6_9CAUD|nr:hypothetical protein UFOVP115_122 [uncultured Caudovirales phage]